MTTKKEIQEEKEAMEIEKMIENGEFIEKDKKIFSSMMKEAIKNTIKKKKIHIGLDNDVLLKIRAISYKEGLPYQTLINSVLKKYVTNKLN